MTADRTATAELGYQRQFTMVPGVIMETRMSQLGANGIALMLMVLHIAGKYGTTDAFVSHRTLADKLGWSVNRAQAAKKDLCNAIPEVFTLIPGCASERRPDVIRVDRAALAELHRAYLAETGSSAGSSNTSSAPAAPAKAAGTKKSNAISDAEIERFVSIWNELKHANHAAKRVASAAERRGIQSIVSAHKGDVDAALDSWTLAVTEVARLGADPNALFWGSSKDRTSAPGMANLLPHWSKHADAARARNTRKQRPSGMPTYTPPDGNLRFQNEKRQQQQPPGYSARARGSRSDPELVPRHGR